MNGFEKIGFPVDYFQIESDQNYDRGIVKCQSVKFDGFYEYIEVLNKLGFWSQSNDSWTFGKEFKNKALTDEALKNGSSSKEMLERIFLLKSKIEGLEDIQRTLSIFETMKRKRVFREDGSELDIDRLLSGNPEHWQKTTKGLSKPVVSLAINNTVSASRSIEEIMNMVSMAIIACEMLEKAGFNTQLISLSTWTGANIGYKYSVSYCIVKRANEPIDIEKLSNLGLPSIGRYLWFKSVDCGFSGRPRNGKGDGRGSGIIIKSLLDYFDISCLINQDHSNDQYSFNLKKIFSSIEPLKKYFDGSRII